MKIKILYFIFPILVLVSCFCSFGFMCNAQALPNEFVLDSNTYQVLYGSGGAGTNTIDFGMNADPNFICYGVDQVLNDINNNLYTKYGWDLETLSWKIEDQTKENCINALKGGGTLPSGDYQLLSTLAPIGQGIGNWFQQYILGTVDSLGNITNVLNKSVTKIDSNLIDTMTSVKSDLLSNGDIINFTVDKVLYTDKVNFSGNTSYAAYVVQFNKPVLFFNSGVSDPNGGYKISVCFPDDLDVQLGDCYTVSSSGQTSLVPYVSLNNSSYFQVNSVVYRYANINFSYGHPNYYDVSTNNVPYLDLEGIKTLLQSSNLFGNNISHGYNTSSGANFYLRNILDLLNGHWVTDDQLRLINEKVDGLTIGNIDINGDGTPVINTDTDYLEELRQLIEDIINQNQDLDDELGYDPDPNPNPNPNPDPVYDDQGISIIPDFPIPVINNLKSVLTLPLHVFSIFQPLFRVFGVYFSSLWGLWLFVPSCVLIGFLIWLIK